MKEFKDKFIEEHKKKPMGNDYKPISATVASYKSIKKQIESVQLQNKERMQELKEKLEEDKQDLKNKQINKSASPRKSARQSAR